MWNILVVSYFQTKLTSQTKLNSISIDFIWLKVLCNSCTALNLFVYLTLPANIMAIGTSLKETEQTFFGLHDTFPYNTKPKK